MRDLSGTIWLEVHFSYIQLDCYPICRKWTHRVRLLGFFYEISRATSTFTTTTTTAAIQYHNYCNRGSSGGGSFAGRSSDSGRSNCSGGHCRVSVSGAAGNNVNGKSRFSGSTGGSGTACGSPSFCNSLPFQRSVSRTYYY